MKTTFPAGNSSPSIRGCTYQLWMPLLILTTHLYVQQFGYSSCKLKKLFFTFCMYYKTVSGIVKNSSTYLVVCILSCHHPCPYLGCPWVSIMREDNLLPWWWPQRGANNTFHCLTCFISTLTTSGNQLMCGNSSSVLFWLCNIQLCWLAILLSGSWACSVSAPIMFPCNTSTQGCSTSLTKQVTI